MAGYLRRRVAAQVLALLLVLTALMQVLELLDVTTDILERDLGLKGLAYYALLRTPAELVLALPLAMLLGTMTALYSMARGIEITAMRSAGIGLMRMFVCLLPVPLLLALAQFLMSEHVLPRAEETLIRWWEAHAPPDEDAGPMWVNTAGGPVSIERRSADGHELWGLRIFEPDEQGRLRGRTQAAQASWRGGQWRLQDVRSLRIDGERLRRTHEERRAWQTNLAPADVLRIDVARPQLSSMMLADLIAGTRVGTQPLSYYKTVLYRSFAAPFGVFIMLLVALPTAAVNPRGQGGGREMILVLSLGLGFMLCDGMIAALGTSGQLPPWITAIAAPTIFAIIGLGLLKEHDRL